MRYALIIIGNVGFMEHFACTVNCVSFVSVCIGGNLLYCQQYWPCISVCWW